MVSNCYRRCQTAIDGVKTAIGGVKTAMGGVKTNVDSHAAETNDRLGHYNNDTDQTGIS